MQNAAKSIFRIIVALLLIFFYASFAQAQPNPHWYRDKWWWVGEAIIGSSIFMDGHSSARGQPYYVEGNPLLGKHPSNARIAGFAGLDFGLQTTYHALAWHWSHDDNKFWRNLGRWAIPTEVALIVGRQGIENYRLPKQPQPAGKLVYRGFHREDVIR